MNLESLRLEIQGCNNIIYLNLESLRLEIQPNIKTGYLIESRVFETRDSIKKTRLYIQVIVSHVAVHPYTYLSSVTLSPKNRASSTLTHTLSSLTLTPLTLTHHIASLTAFPSQQFHISGKGFLI